MNVTNNQNCHCCLPGEAFPGLPMNTRLQLTSLSLILFPCFSQPSCWCESVYILFTYFVYFLFSSLECKLHQSRSICLLSSCLSPASRKTLSKCWQRD